MKQPRKMESRAQQAVRVMRQRGMDNVEIGLAIRWEMAIRVARNLLTPTAATFVAFWLALTLGLLAETLIELLSR